MAQVSMYEEEEGYVSGEYDEGPFELVKIRVKVRLGSPFFHFRYQILINWMATVALPG
jgi:hypothetical protein